MRLAILGLNYAPEEIGIGRYSTNMAETLAERGHDVTVIAGKPYYPQWEIFSDFRRLGWLKAVERGVRITRCPHYVPAKPSGMKRIAHLVSFSLAALLPAIGLRAARPQVVLCVAPSLISVPVAWLAARLNGARLWLHVQDFEVEAAFATGLLDEKGVLPRLARWCENRLLALGDRVSTISPQMCAKLADKGVARDRIVEIRNWADSQTHFSEDAGQNPFRAEWGLGDAQVCLYSGNIANKQGVDILVDAARILRERTDIVFVICGQGPSRERLEQLAEGLDNIQFHDLQPMEQVGDLLSLATLHLLPQIPVAADLVLPSKLTNILASGRPVVATAEAGTGLYDEVDGCGLNTKPGDALALAQAITTLIDEPELRARMGQEGRARVIERWSMARIIDKLEYELISLANKRPAA